jgi:DNA-directed RNA polymerase subunit M/transcription elongation factor TFIIS
MFLNTKFSILVFKKRMTTVIRGRARKPAVEPSVVEPSRPSVFEGGFLGWAQKKAEHELRKQVFSYELFQGIIKPQETLTFTTFDTNLLESMIRHYQGEYELNKDVPGFQQALDAAVQTNNLDFDFDTWEPEFTNRLSGFQDYEVVFFRNRTTAFTLPRPCPNCGQKKLIAEGAVFTRAADEAASQFATCKNCSSRFRLQSVL